MPPIQWADVVGADSALASVPPAMQNLILGRVEALSASFFGGEDSAIYKLARVLLAAHMATPLVHAVGGQAAAGPVTSESEGGVSRSYAVLEAARAGAHSSTTHGRAFDELVRSRPNRLGVTS